MLQTAPSFMPNAEINRAKLTAYVSCPFVVLLLVVIASFPDLLRVKRFLAPWREL